MLNKQQSEFSSTHIKLPAADLRAHQWAECPSEGPAGNKKFMLVLCSAIQDFFRSQQRQYKNTLHSTTPSEMLLFRVLGKEVTNQELATLIARAAKSSQVEPKRQKEWSNSATRIDFELVTSAQLYRQLLIIIQASYHTKPERILLIDALLLAVSK